MNDLRLVGRAASAEPEAVAATGGARSKDGPGAVLDAARQFEALLISQILRSAGGENGLFGSGSGGQSDAVLEMGAEQFALVLARQGGLGIAELIAQGLQPARPASPALKAPGA